ncbi:MAG: hypothetical protein HZY79_15185 [Rhodoblastus sp.]|nr:MAG: hypothetical protein HZY79_15185 [Rhodoblastus sp.]
MTQDTQARRRATLFAALFLIALLAIGIWVAQAISERQALERCVAERRRDCGEFGAKLPDAPTRDYAPTR